MICVQQAGREDQMQTPGHETSTQKTKLYCWHESIQNQTGKLWKEHTGGHEGDREAEQKKTKGLNTQTMMRERETDGEHSWDQLHTTRQRMES